MKKHDNLINILNQLNKASLSQDGKNMQKHCANVVFTLQSKLANVSSDFKNTLETRNQVFSYFSILQL